MKCVILAGGYGTRLAEKTDVRPKPMVRIGERPILWHIMKIYSHYGVQDFVICLGYKGNVIKDYFSNYYLYESDVTFDVRNNQMKVHNEDAEPWRVTLVDTGDGTMTGGRLKRVREHVQDGTFCFTYGDGVGNVDVGRLLDFHEEQDTRATMTAVQPPGRFGTLEMEDDKVQAFREKPKGHSWINGGFMVLEPEVIDYIDGDDTVWEEEPLEGLADDGELAAYRHEGFWQPMDKLSDKRYLEDLWTSDQPPWKVWDA